MLMVLALHASLVTPCRFTGDALLARQPPERGRSATLLGGQDGSTGRYWMRKWFKG